MVISSTHEDMKKHLEQKQIDEAEDLFNRLKENNGMWEWDPERDYMTIDNEKEICYNYCKHAVVEVKGLMKDGKPLDASNKDDLILLFEKDPFYVKQIMEFSQDIKNFFY